MKAFKIIGIAAVVMLGFLAFGCTPRSDEVHAAAKAGDVAKVKAMLDANPALINAKGDYGWTPLHVAAIEGQRAVVELLLAKGANVNARDRHGETPLTGAVINDSKEVMELLLAKGAEVNVKDSVLGRTPLHTAAVLGHSDVAELLLTKGAEVNVRDKDGKTPLRLA